MKSAAPFASIQEMAVFCHQWLNETLMSLPEGRNFSVALSGGSTPAALFDALVALEQEKTAVGIPGLPWHVIHFFWGDERCVPPDHAESNFRMTREHLLEPLGIRDGQIHRILGEREPVSEAERYATHLNAVLPLVDGFPCFDLIVLGLGDDGHTASLFPGHEQLFDTDQGCQAVLHPVTGQARVTLTGSLINRASTVAFLVTGASKADMVKTIKQQASLHERLGTLTAPLLPAALVAPVSGRVCWLLDEAAAGLHP